MRCHVHKNKLGKNEMYTKTSQTECLYIFHISLFTCDNTAYQTENNLSLFVSCLEILKSLLMQRLWICSPTQPFLFCTVFFFFFFVCSTESLQNEINQRHRMPNLLKYISGRVKGFIIIDLLVCSILGIKCFGRLGTNKNACVCDAYICR